MNNIEKYCASFKMLIKCEENILDEYNQYINSNINKNNQNNCELGNSLNYDCDNDKSGENDHVIDKSHFNNVSEDINFSNIKNIRPKVNNFLLKFFILLYIW